ncbi:sensor histidine kinase [Paenibacillus sp. YSY-4.3]
MAKWGGFRFRSIRTEIAVAFSCLIVCTTAVLTLNTFLLSSEAVKQNSSRYSAKLIEQVNTNITTYVGNMTSISDMARQNGDLQALMYSSDPDGEEGRDYAARTADFFRVVAESRQDIAAILFVGSNGAVVSDRNRPGLKDYGELTRQEWYASAQEAKGREVITSSRVQHLFQGEYRWVVSICRQIGPDTAGQTAGGVLLVDLNYNVINDLGKSLQMGSRGYVFIVAPDGSFVYHPQQQLIYSGLKSEPIEAILASGDAAFEAENDGVAKLYTVRNSVFGWKIVGVNDPEELAGNKGQIQNTSFLWGGISLVFALGVSLLLSLKLTEPVKNLGRQMKKLETGNFDVRVEITGINEIGRLARTFNLMAAKIKQLVNQLMQEQEEKRVSELKALQAQIQPHFLYNTLDSIIWMAEMDKSAEVVTMTSALSKLLRSSISRGEELVSIRAELEHVQNYLTIQTIRYRDKFTYSLDIDPAILGCLTIKLVLQPLVENAIYHGIRSMEDRGHITVRGRRTADGIDLAVSDNGLGMTPEQQKRLVMKLQSQSQTQFQHQFANDMPDAFQGGMELAALLKEQEQGHSAGGVGLFNVNHRVQLHFGRKYGLSVESELEEGTTVSLRIPELNERRESHAGTDMDCG